MTEERHGRRRILIANPDEPRAGDYAYQLYDKAHPVFGDPEVIASMRRQLRGLRGETVVMRVKGAHIDEDGTVHRFTARRTFVMNRYSDVFGPGSAYASMVHAVREKHSDEVLVTYAIEIDPEE
jgi:hypothetical protein